MVVRLLSVLGWVVARTPETALRALVRIGGAAAYALLPRRRRLMLSNLHHAFPERPATWRRRVARICSGRVIETGLLSLATPHLSPERIRGLARLGPVADGWVRAIALQPRATVLGTLHLALWESQTWLKLIAPAPLPEFGIIFRPLDHSAANLYVKATRERFGMQLLSRRDGFARALQIVRGGGCVGVLFDQNAGMQGCLTLLFGRVCSTTELPGLLAAKYGAELRVFYPRRTGFWRVEFECVPVAHDGSAAGATLALNRWLEIALAGDDDLCASWLWGHNRWRHQDVPASRLHLESKRDLLAEDLAARGLPALPRRTRIWIRLPNWLGDVVMAAPLLRALRHSRPDAEVTVLGRPGFAPLVGNWDFVDRFLPLPPRGVSYFRAFWRWREEYPDLWIALTQSARGDLEGWLTGAAQRFGLGVPGRWRPLLTHRHHAAAEPNPTRTHQLDRWEACWRRFGLTGAISRAPLAPLPAVDPAGRDAAALPPIGLIAGSENNPEKRWPVERWRLLIEALPDDHFVLFGTKADRVITTAVAADFPSKRVLDLAGRTDLKEYMERLRGCRVVIANDTGGMHLANALGVAVIVLFGPTNPLRTGPVFAAPRVILQPPDCPETGGAPLDGLPADAVIAAVQSLKGS